METIPLFDLNFDETEIDAVVDVLKSKWISMGPKVNEFETNFAKRLNIKHAVAVNNCTAALALALQVSGVQQGDEVILPSLTFVATANAVLQVGATPVFADIVSTHDWTLCPKSVRSKITAKTKAIIPMHYAGYLADMKEFRSIADLNNLVIIEDGAHSPNSVREDYTPGQFGDILCLSFFANKNITTGEGGMLLTQNDHFFQKAKTGRAHGISSSSYERSLGQSFYEVKDWGWNFRMSDINAAIGLAQIKKLDHDKSSREKLVQLYRTELKDSSYQIPFHSYQGASSHYILPCLLNKEISRTKIRNYLSDLQIQTSMHYPPVHLFQHYSKLKKTSLPITEDIGRRLLTLPLFAKMSKDQVIRVCDTLKAYSSESIS